MAFKSLNDRVRLRALPHFFAAWNELPGLLVTFAIPKSIGSPRARAILDVLQRRGIALSDAQVERIATCRDEATLARWWEMAWTAGTGDELVAVSERTV